MNRWLKVFLAVGVGVAVVLLIAGLGIYSQIRASLPRLEGEVQVSGLSAPVNIERDSLGVPSILGENEADVARSLGFVHAQDRFFQMDLMRRQAAGELAELIGYPVLDIDLSSRIHQFRVRAERVLEAARPRHREILNAYVEGVNAGLLDLGQKPFEYFLLRSDPVPWKAADSILVVMAMFFILNDEEGSRDSDLGVLNNVLPPEMAEFLAPDGTEWDAPIVGQPLVSTGIPGPEILDLRNELARGRSRLLEPTELGGEWVEGSNNWAVAGSRTRDGRAILADDMHLGLSVPNTWYRSRSQWQEKGSEITVTGLTLPGAPFLVVGNNNHVAWGFTNTGGDWVDLVVLETHPDDPNQYRTPEGYRTFEQVQEVIDVRGQEPRILDIRQTIWGPVLDEDHLGRPRALRWIAHEVEAVNLVHGEMARATTVDEAIETANRSGIPPQNFVCADKEGRIAWTVEGRIPRRIGFDGKLPVSWADGSRGWNGWLEPEEYPRIVDPESGTIWTANARVVDGQMLEMIGFGGYALGARAKQIRDGLFALEIVSESDMLAIQLDHRAVFLGRWRTLILDLLSEKAIDDNEGRKTFRRVVAEGWTGKASVDSVGYRIVRAFRAFTAEKVLGWLTARCTEADDRFSLNSLYQREQPLWLLVTEQPIHLLDPRYGSWNEFLLSVVDFTIDYYGGADTLVERTWGERNTTRIQHPLSRALTFLSPWLDMPSVPLPGDENMPRVQGPNSGASERLVVSPGHEEDGYLHMPAGQSGHPLSPFYGGAGHEAWEVGHPSPFLPGEPEKILKLVR
jgi:penicillin amidase